MRASKYKAQIYNLSNHKLILDPILRFQLKYCIYNTLSPLQ